VQCEVPSLYDLRLAGDNSAPHLMPLRCEGKAPTRLEVVAQAVGAC